MTNYNRRDFLKFGLGAWAATLLPMDVLASIATRRPPVQRSLSFYNTHTSEKLRICYYEQGAYRPEALSQVNHILRDHRTDKIKPIDPKLLDLLYFIKSRIRTKAPFHVISAYRSPQSNQLLRLHSHGVASDSYHLKGRAIDIRLPGYSTRRLRNLCLNLKAGGVGFYPRSDFVHIDTGPVRKW